MFESGVACFNSRPGWDICVPLYRMLENRTFEPLQLETMPSPSNPFAMRGTFARSRTTQSERVAQAVIECAEIGERDLERLKLQALVSLNT